MITFCGETRAYRFQIQSSDRFYPVVDLARESFFTEAPKKTR